MTQEGDVLLSQGLDNGDINVVGGIVEMTQGLETAILLSLFGGNETDDGQDDSQTWWGNLSETEPSKTYRSETQFLVNTLPANSINRLRIRDAALRDLQYLLDDGIATDVTLDVFLTGGNGYKILCVVETVNGSTAFEALINGRGTP